MAISFIDSTSGITSSNTTLSQAVSKPSGLVTGDCLVLAMFGQPAASSDITFGGLTGWTFQAGLLDADSATTRVRVSLYQRIVDGSEPASWTFTKDSAATTGRFGGIISAYRGTDGIGTTAFINGTGAGSTARTGPSLTTSASGWLVYGLADQGAATGYTSVSGGTSRQQPVSSNVGAALFDSAGNVAAGSYQRDFTSTSSTTVYVTWAASLTPATAGPSGSSTVSADSYAKVDFTATPGTGGNTLTYTPTVPTGSIQQGTSTWWVPKSTAPQAVSCLVTESNGKTLTLNATVPALTSGTGSLRVREFTGTGTVS